MKKHLDTLLIIFGLFGTIIFFTIHAMSIEDRVRKITEGRCLKEFQQEAVDHGAGKFVFDYQTKTNKFQWNK